MTPAAQDAPCRHQFTYALRNVDGQFQLSEEGDHVATVPTRDGALLALEGRLRRRLFDYFSRAGWTLLDCGVGSVGGRRFLVFGGADGARAALLADLLLEGFNVVGGEAALLRQGDILPLPLPLRLPVAAAKAAPKLWPLVEGRPSVASPSGPVVAVDPRTAGSGWSALRGPAVAAFVLGTPNTEAQSVTPLPTPAALQVVLRAQVVTHGSDHAAAAREVARLVRHTPVYAIPGGSVATGTQLLREALIHDGGEAMGSLPPPSDGR